MFHRFWGSGNRKRVYISDYFSEIYNPFIFYSLCPCNQLTWLLAAGTSHGPSLLQTGPRGNKESSHTSYGPLLVAILARRPLHGALAKDVDMQVLYCLLAVLTGVDHAAVSVLQTLLRAYLFDLEHHVSHKLCVLLCQIVE